MQNVLYRATLETANFTFEAIHVTKHKARHALIDAIPAHCRAFGINLGTFRSFYPSRLIEVREIRVGKTYRDGEMIDVFR